MGKNPLDAWNSLNARQRTYLLALYDCDQSKEAIRRMDAARGFWDRTPASEWRWIMYGPTAPPSELYTELRSKRLVDPGTGSTWKALDDRGFVETGEIRDALGIPLLRIKITPLGRKVVRAGTGEEAPKRSPKGQLRERQWAALAMLYAAGEQGHRHDYMTLGAYGTRFNGFDWARTLLRLREYQPHSLMEEYNEWVQVLRDEGTQYRQEYRMRITPHGRDYYEQNYQRYRELYPDVEAPEPAIDKAREQG